MSKSLLHHEASNFLDALLASVLGEHMFRIFSCFNVTVPSSWRIEERVLEEIHLLYVRSGCLTYVIHETPLELTAGSLLFLTDGTIHSAYRDLKEPLSIIPIRFTIASYKNDEEQVAKTELPCHFAFRPRDPSKFSALFETIHRYHTLPSSARRDVLCHAAICQTLAEISLDLDFMRQDTLSHPDIQNIKAYIDTHPAERLSVQELAGFTGLTSKYCSKLFQQIYGIPIKTYQIKARIDYARYLLENSGQSIKEISFQLGYTDPFTFSKQYKAVTGVSPSKRVPRFSGDSE
ncbi:helix-turn-helix domain-containing protein [Paenibacillus sp. HJL G12]|uniref:Helix-turn-helix domain-containing protein n=1 Tax=Paenibacillus dendrobii TaxID=2691084 RepID=A0A7X3IG78_9BACL|nr:AraC family transcriptional regulator [Paenibacillus dendrobii]MWV42706.1 helix-turn-helix domain-containing protein [Paenibacillus dendrobii]